MRSNNALKFEEIILAKDSLAPDFFGIKYFFCSLSDRAAFGDRSFSLQKRVLQIFGVEIRVLGRSIEEDCSRPPDLVPSEEMESLRDYQECFLAVEEVCTSSRDFAV